MPALAEGSSWKRKCRELSVPEDFPAWLKRSILRIVRDNQFDRKDKLRLLISYAACFPVRSICNIGSWFKKKVGQLFAPTVPVVLTTGRDNAVRVENCVRKYLSGVFLQVVCGDDISWWAIRRSQARQQLVYLTKRRSFLRIGLVLSVDDLSDQVLAFQLVEGFAVFNQRRQN